ncbi:MAG: VWA domain-containing protein [Candidatus Babeliales bacterium]|nr:VWA domain-containing protein [Candidatus Babeliales bacterium]
MFNTLILANFYYLYFLIPIFILALIYKLKFFKAVTYKYTLTSLLKKNAVTKNYANSILFFLRACSLLILIILIAKPQFVDTKSKINVEGIDIVLALDVSGSMQCFDDLKDRRSRIDIAKEEAIKFIEKRHDDQIGLVLFGKYTVSRCPLTLDKNILYQIIDDYKIGEINAEGTVLALAISNAANRLKYSKAKSKIVILLTDGEPSPPDIEPQIAINIAKKLGVKIYTIGIGNINGGYIDHPMMGIYQGNSSLNTRLLEQIAIQTGGKFFLAQNATDMQNIYDTIDKLEKTDYETTIYTKYHDFFIPLIFMAIFFLLLELILTTFIWFRL